MSLSRESAEGMPAVSLVVTSYYHERFVEAALDSAVAQTFTDYELLIIDDASQDRTVERIRAWLDRTAVEARLIVNEENLGFCATLNRALASTAAPYFSQLSADDVYEPQKLERQHAIFATASPSVAVVYSDATTIDDEGRVIARPRTGPRPDGCVFDALLRGNFIPGPAVMVRREAIEAVGGYDESLSYEDLDMWLRLADRYEFRYCSGALARYRTLPDSMWHGSSSRMRMIDSTERLYGKWKGSDARRDAKLDAAFERHLRRQWSLAARLFVTDPAAAMPVLRRVYEARPGASRRAFLAAARVPGFRVALRPVIALHDGATRLRASRRRPAGELSAAG